MPATVSSDPLLPVLCGPSSRRGAAMLSFPVVRQALVPDRVFVLLATVGPTPHGTIGMDWLTRERHRTMGEPPFADLLETAAGNLEDGLRIDGHETDDGLVLVLARDGAMAGSAVALPEFHGRLSSILGARRLVVGVPSHDELLVADADGGTARQVRQLTLDARCPDSLLGPTVLLIDAGGARLLAERDV
jgi:hypothetical protein